MNDVRATIDQINRSCKELSDAFRELAEAALPVFDGIESSIGRLTQWKVLREQAAPDSSGSSPIPPTVHYYDAKPRWWEVLFFGLEVVGEVPHPRAQEARDAAELLYGKVMTNDEVYGAHVESIATTPQQLGEIMGEWLEVLDAFNSGVAAQIPSNPSFLATSGGLEGWRSPQASAGYAATFSSQNRAADTTAEVIEGLLNNCAGFLDHLGGSLAAFADVAGDQDTFYTSVLFDMLPTKLSLDSILGLLETGTNVVNGTKEMEKNVIEEVAKELNSEIAGLLGISALEGKITRMGESSHDDGWPQPAPMNTHNLQQSGPATRDELVFNAQYFKDHINFWEDTSSTLSPLGGRARGIPQLPSMFERLPSFSASQSAALNSLGDRIAGSCLTQGATATAMVAEKLEVTIRAYVTTEAANAIIAGQILNDQFGG